MPDTFIRKYHLQLRYKSGASRRGSSLETLATIENYRVQGTFRFSSAGVSSTADSHIISIYNAPDNIVSSLRERGVTVELRAGYVYDNGITYSEGDDLPLLFKGEKVKSKTYKDGLNTVTDILMSTAFSEKREATVSTYFARNTPLTEVLNELAKTLKIGSSNSSSVIPTVVFLGDEDKVRSLRKSITLFGNTATVLERIANSYGLVHWYQKDKLYICSPSTLAKVNPTNTVFKIEPGRIKGVVNWTTDDTVKTRDKDTSLKADFTTFLIPHLEIGNSVELEIDGSLVTLVVTALEHDIDTHGEQWDTRIVAESGVK